MDTYIAIIYDPPFCKAPLVVAKVKDDELLFRVAESVLAEERRKFENDGPRRRVAWYRNKQLVALMELLLPKRKPTPQRARRIM